MNKVLVFATSALEEFQRGRIDRLDEHRSRVRVRCDGPADPACPEREHGRRMEAARALVAMISDGAERHHKLDEGMALLAEAGLALIRHASSVARPSWRRA